MKSSNAVYQRVADELGLKLKGRTEKTFQSGIYSYLSSNHKMMWVYLTIEIDNFSCSYIAFIITKKVCLLQFANSWWNWPVGK